MGFKISTSKDGFDVLGTAITNPNNVNYDSDYNTLKYYSQGSIQVAGSALQGSSRLYRGTVTHNLGFYPYTECMVQDITTFGDSSRYFLNEYNAAPAGGFTYKAFFDIGTANMRFNLLLEHFGLGTATIFGTVNFFYKLFRNDTGL